jgi:SAM-dependent methyltransferase
MVKRWLRGTGLLNATTRKGQWVMSWRETCPACDDPRAVKHGERGSFVIVRCLGCGVVYSNPQPRETVRQWNLEEWDLAAQFAPLAARKRVLFERRLTRLPSPQPSRDRLCDVGCADGQFLERAAARGWRPHGIEMNPPAAARARARGATIFEGPLEELEDLPWGSFDLVTCWDCLEHTPEPRLFAERLARLLASGGYLALTTLNRRSLAWAVFGMRWSMVWEDHFTYWDYRSLTRLFQPLGLVMVDSDIFGLGRDFVTVLDRLRHKAVNAPAAQVPAEPSDGGWDVHPVVLALETALNHVFRVVGGGVGIGLTLRKV